MSKIILMDFKQPCFSDDIVHPLVPRAYQWLVGNEPVVVIDWIVYKLTDCGLLLCFNPNREKGFLLVPLEKQHEHDLDLFIKTLQKTDFFFKRGRRGS